MSRKTGHLHIYPSIYFWVNCSSINITNVWRYNTKIQQLYLCFLFIYLYLFIFILYYPIFLKVYQESQFQLDIKKKIYIYIYLWTKFYCCLIYTSYTIFDIVFIMLRTCHNQGIPFFCCISSLEKDVTGYANLMLMICLTSLFL